MYHFQVETRPFQAGLAVRWYTDTYMNSVVARPCLPFCLFFFLNSLSFPCRVYLPACLQLRTEYDHGR